MVDNPDQPTQQQMATKFGVSKRHLRRVISKKLVKKTVKKPKGHYLSEAMIEKRRLRSWPLYRTLSQDKWKKFITTDEAWFYLNNTGGKSRIEYISRSQNKSMCEFSREERLQLVL